MLSKKFLKGLQVNSDNRKAMLQKDGKQLYVLSKDNIKPDLIFRTTLSSWNERCTEAISGSNQTSSSC